MCRGNILFNGKKLSKLFNKKNYKRQIKQNLEKKK